MKEYISREVAKAEFAKVFSDMENKTLATCLGNIANEILDKVSANRQISEYDHELRQAKRLLKAAVDDFTAIAEVHAAATPILCPQYGKYMKAIDVRTRKWQYADEALALIGKDIDVPATETNINVGGKEDGDTNE